MNKFPLRVLAIALVSCLGIGVMCVFVGAAQPISQLDPMPATTPLPYYPKGFAYFRGGTACSSSQSLGYGDYLRQSLSSNTVCRVHGHGWSFYEDNYCIMYLIYVCVNGSNQPGGAYAENYRIYLPRDMTTSGVYGELGKVEYKINAIYNSNYDVQIYIDDGNYTVPLRQTRTFPTTPTWTGSDTQTFSVMFVNASSIEPVDEWIILAEIDLRIYVKSPTVGDGRSIDIDPETLFGSMSDMFTNLSPIFNTTLMVGMLDILAFGMAVHYVVKLS